VLDRNGEVHKPGALVRALIREPEGAPGNCPPVAVPIIGAVDASEGLSAAVVGLLYRLDPPGNLFPSSTLLCAPSSWDCGRDP
jgi:hypothetical protein